MVMSSDKGSSVYRDNINITFARVLLRVDYTQTFPLMVSRCDAEVDPRVQEAAFPFHGRGVQIVPAYILCFNEFLLEEYVDALLQHMCFEDLGIEHLCALACERRLHMNNPVVARGSTSEVGFHTGLGCPFFRRNQAGAHLGAMAKTGLWLGVSFLVRKIRVDW